MKITEAISSLFSSETSTTSYEENNSELSYSCYLNSIDTPQKTALERIFSLIPARDFLRVSVLFDNSDDPVELDKSRMDEFLSDFSSKLELLDKDNDESPELKIKIEKGTDQEDRVSVYDIDQIVDFWSQGGVVSSLTKIQNQKSRARILCIMNLDSAVHTNLFHFLPGIDSDSCDLTKDLNRDELLTKRDKICHFANGAEYDLVPDDFYIKSPNAPESLKSLFSRLKLLVSLVFICDFSRFDDDTVCLSLSGYRLFKKDVTEKDNFPTHSSDEYYDIYKWIYGHGELIDKVGLARNLVSLHLDNDDLLAIQQGALQSITSGYQIYLKENVKQYIELKNRVSEFIQASSDKASEIAKNIGSYYRNSIWTLYSFFFSIFLIRAFIQNDSDLITTEVLYFFLAFAVLTILAMVYALNELDQDKKRLEQGYASLKSRYRDLLLPEDLAKILDYDRQHESDLKYLEKKKSQYRILWGGSLAVVSVIIGILWLVGQH